MIVGTDGCRGWMIVGTGWLYGCRGWMIVGTDGCRGRALYYL